MTEPQRKRWLDEKPFPLEDFMAGAVNYWQNASEQDRQYIRVKPYNGGPDFEHFFETFMRFLQLLRAADLKPRSRVLDIGSGTCWTSEIMARLGHTVTAVEPGPEFLEIGRERVESYPVGPFVGVPPAIEFIAADIAEFEADDDAYDAVFFFDSLHHIDDERQLFEKLSRWLKEGGTLAIYEGPPPAPGSPGEEESLQQMRDYGVLENPFYPEYLDSLLEEFGFATYERLLGMTHAMTISDLHEFPVKERLQELREGNMVVAELRIGKAITSRSAETLEGHWEFLGATEETDHWLLSMKLVNDSTANWLPTAEGKAGEITISTKCGPESGPWTEIVPRNPMLKPVPAGQSVDVPIKVDKAQLGDASHITVDLVCEQRFWGSSVGFTPIVLPVARFRQ